jgi:hypothetical protein
MPVICSEITYSLFHTHKTLNGISDCKTNILCMISVETPFDVQSNVTLLTPVYSLCSVVMLTADHTTSCSFTCMFCEMYSPYEVVFCLPLYSVVTTMLTQYFMLH